MLKMKIFIVKRGKLVQLKIITAIFMVITVLTTTSNAIAQNDGHPLITAFEGSYIESQAEGPWTKIRIVEEKPMETGMVKVTADILKTNILKDGHMAVYGIYFDTDKSDIKPKEKN